MVHEEKIDYSINGFRKFGYHFRRTNEKVRSLHLFTLKSKQPVIFPAKWVYLGIAEELQSKTGKPRQSTGKSRGKRRSKLLYKEKETSRLGGAILNGSPLEERQKFRVVTVSHWLNCGIFSLAELVGGEEKLFFPPAGVGEKVGLFLLGSATDNTVVGHEDSLSGPPNSVLNEVFFISFHTSYQI